MSSSINFDYYFQALTTDNNGKTCTDINVGLKNLFEPFCEEKPHMVSSERILAGELDEGYPDLVAYKSMFGSQELWWWILLACRLDDAFTGIKQNYVYPIFEQIVIDNVKTNSSYDITENNEKKSTGNEIGQVVELN